LGKHGVNVVVGVPTFGMVSIYFMQGRLSQQFPLVSSAIDKFVLNKPIADARNEIVQFALDCDANYVFWLDDDVVAPSDAFLKMWRHNKDIINGVYWSKSNPPMPLLFRGHLDGPYMNWHYGDLIEIDAAGNGLTLVKTDVYRQIEKKMGGPWYSVEYGSFAGVKESPFNNTEDLYFYWKARECGYKIWADTTIQAPHYDKNNNVLYSMPANSPQANPAWTIKPKGTKLIADIGSGPISPYMADEGEVVSFDIREDVKPDVVCDVRKLPVPDETFDIVFSAHTLEHFGWTNVDKVLKEWTRTLKVGGELRIVVPNLRHVAKRVLDDMMYPTDYWVLYGEQDYPKNFHSVGFTPNTLRDLVASMGVYEDIKIREGDFSGPPTAEAWNLQVKATKVRNLEMDNIAPEYVTPGPANNMSWPFRVYDAINERPKTPEEITADLSWLGEADRQGIEKKHYLLKSINGYALPGDDSPDSDKAFFVDKPLTETPDAVPPMLEGFKRSDGLRLSTQKKEEEEAAAEPELIRDYGFSAATAIEAPPVDIGIAPIEAKRAAKRRGKAE
jgi:predicted SAM-dependent methyltransferase